MWSSCSPPTCHYNLPRQLIDPPVHRALPLNCDGSTGRSSPTFLVLPPHTLFFCLFCLCVIDSPTNEKRGTSTSAKHSLCLSVCLSVCYSVRLSVLLLVCLYVCLCLSACLSFSRMSVCLSVYLSLSFSLPPPI